MTLAAHEFIRRFLLHTLPDGFDRIRHFGFLANSHRAAKLALCRKLLDAPVAISAPEPTNASADRTAGPPAWSRCPCCGGAFAVVSILSATLSRQPAFWNDSS
jgi:hypothetical protein